MDEGTDSRCYVVFRGPIACYKPVRDGEHRVCEFARYDRPTEIKHPAGLNVNDKLANLKCYDFAKILLFETGSGCAGVTKLIEAVLPRRLNLILVTAFFRYESGYGCLGAVCSRNLDDIRSIFF